MPFDHVRTLGRSAGQNSDGLCAAQNVSSCQHEILGMRLRRNLIKKDDALFLHDITFDNSVDKVDNTQPTIILDKLSEVMATNVSVREL